MSKMSKIESKYSGTRRFQEFPKHLGHLGHRGHVGLGGRPLQFPILDIRGSMSKMILDMPPRGLFWPVRYVLWPARCVFVPEVRDGRLLREGRARALQGAEAIAPGAVGQRRLRASLDLAADLHLRHALA